MHGTGNDYVYIDCFKQNVDNPRELAIKISDRHKGIGSDGLILIMPSTGCDFRMRMFNADGSEAQMCGNGARCAGKLVYDSGYTDRVNITMETLAGIKNLELYPVNGKVEKVKVDMGSPELKVDSIPVIWNKPRLVNEVIDFEPEKYAVTALATGNPHAVIFTDDVDSLDLETAGRKIEHHPMFPERVNVEFVEIISPVHAKMRVWERGSGETMSCGTGACAVVVAGALNGKLQRRSTVSLPGGELEIEWNESSDRIFLTGEAVTVFEGTY